MIKKFFILPMFFGTPLFSSNISNNDNLLHYVFEFKQKIDVATGNDVFSVQPSMKINKTYIMDLFIFWQYSVIKNIKIESFKKNDNIQLKMIRSFYEYFKDQNVDDEKLKTAVFNLKLFLDELYKKKQNIIL